MTELIIILFLILLNGFFAMAEIALISVRKSYLNNEIKRGSHSAATALKLARDPNDFLSTIQIGITLIGILTGIYSGNVLAQRFSLVLVHWGMSITYSYVVAQALIVIGVTYLTLIFGELLPKRIGMSAAEEVAKLVARPMNLLSLLATPFVWMLSRSTGVFFRLLGLSEQENVMTEEEIKSIIQESTETGEVQEVEQDIVERVFLLGDLKINVLMTHRTELVCLRATMSREAVLQVMRENLHEFYPVMDEAMNGVVGGVPLKKLIRLFEQDDLTLLQLMEPPFFFPDNLSVYKALEQMKQEGISQTLVCDEFGSFQGMITLRDIMEGLVGSFHDVYAEPAIISRPNDEGWLIDGQCPFYDFLSHFNQEYLYTQHPYKTLGGLVLELLEHIPRSGERVEWNHFKFEIVDMDGTRIDKILVTQLK